MSAEPVPKGFEKTSQVLPFTKYGLTSFEEFLKAEKDIRHVEWLKEIGLTDEEIKLYQENESGLLEQNKKIEFTILKNKIDYIYKKINSHLEEDSNQPSKDEEEASTSKTDTTDILGKMQQAKTIQFYPEGHPMNKLTQLEEDLFGHLETDIIPLTKRRKILRRFERKKERILAHQNQFIPTIEHPKVSMEGSLWDIKEKTVKPEIKKKTSKIIGPKPQTMYTIKDSKIMRLEPIKPDDNNQGNNEESANAVSHEYRAVDIVLPVNPAEEQLLEGTKMSVDDIRKIERFKDYEPGIPSKVLYIKNISPSVTQDQLSLLFNQFQLDNGGPVDVRLLSGRMRGQAFVSFQSDELAVQALDEVNGTILSGKPVVVQFGRNSNRIQDDNR